MESLSELRLRLGRPCLELHRRTVQGNKFRPSFLFNFVVANERKDDVSKTVPQCSSTQYPVSFVFFPRLTPVSCNAFETCFVIQFPWFSATGPSNAFGVGAVFRLPSLFCEIFLMTRLYSLWKSRNYLRMMILD